MAALRASQGDGHEPALAEGEKRERLDDPPKEYLLVIPRRSPGGAALAGMLGSKDDKVVPDEALDSLLTEAMASAY